MNEFWMVYVEDGGKPNQPYLSYEGALARAKDLAADTGHRVFILKSVQVVSAQVPQVEVTYDVQPIP